ncbi:prepilin-type cleavage/methylation domain-containing protein [Photobacterium sanctipauli]|uniref:Prepilin-type cleavage/methylation domain-containing protein n=1 Tax=Photobacterium sanctipauli TaxID=1342794 RepID=A0A2T3NW24_9GAMM|nr:type II secretion system protein [Photobacterium sanctipauli]PSW20483.1 prepilin-type cleavage/methylation domain-containing protein [Photobacterium sanctipauli]
MKNKGFTLLEMVVVIVILGILAVTAAPRFLNLQDDARVAVLESLSGTILSSAETAFGKMAIHGLESYDYVTNQDLNNQSGISTDLPFPGCEQGASTYCVFRYGYPDADPLTIGHLVDGIYDGTNRDYDFISLYGYDGDEDSSYIAHKDNVIRIGNSDRLINKSCYVKYTPAKFDGDSPKTAVIPCA